MSYDNDRIENNAMLDMEIVPNKRFVDGDYEKFKYLIAFEDDTQFMCHHKVTYNEKSYFIATEYRDGIEGEIQIFECLEDEYIEIIKDDTLKEKIMEQLP